MLKGRKVGTFTAGLSMVVFGVLFLLRIYFPSINYRLILTLWPLILIFLGVEILISFFINKQEVMKYDGGAILLTIILTFFAMGMACAEFAIQNSHYYFYWR